MNDAAPLDRVERYLLLWAAWYRNGKAARLGYPARSLAFATGGDSQRFDDWAEIEAEKAERTAAKVVDALVEGLSLRESCAVRHTWLDEPWPEMLVIRYGPCELSYGTALAELERGINERGLV